MNNKTVKLTNNFPAKILNAITDEIIVLDKNFNVIFSNSACGNKVVNKKCYELLHNIKVPCNKAEKGIKTCPLKKVIQTKKTYTAEHQHTKNGQNVDVKVSVYPIFDDNKKLVYFVEHLRDITKLKDTERQLRESKQNLEIKVKEKTQELEKVHIKLLETERLATLGKMASAVAHELRNPMGIIRLAVYSLKKKIALKDPNLVKHLDNIDKNIVRSDSIIHDLLAFSRAQELEFKLNHLNESIEKGLEFVKQQAAEQNVNIIKNLDPESPLITADFNQLTEIFSNIFLNAIQAMEESKKKELRVSTRHQDNFVEVEISDTGCGISKENMKKLGEPFFSTKTKGIGLGLYIAYEIMRRHKGGISIKSAVGKGTTFVIKLPRKLNSNKSN